MAPMRALLIGLFAVVVAATAWSAGGRAGGVAPEAPEGDGALDVPTEIDGCGACTLRHQSISRRLEEKRAAAGPDPDCQVKGDITPAGERVYHLPGGPAYDLVWISAERGERWFCSAAEAEGAGWRAAGS